VVIFGLAAMGLPICCWALRDAFIRAEHFWARQFTPLHLLTRWHCLTLVFSHGDGTELGVGWITIHKKERISSYICFAFYADVFISLLYRNQTDRRGQRLAGHSSLLITAFWPDAPGRWPPLAVPVNWPCLHGGILAVLKVSRSTFGRTAFAVRDNWRGSTLWRHRLQPEFKSRAMFGVVTGLAGALHAAVMNIAPLSNARNRTSE
jgi:branched-chain amino acid transport system permease protein